MKRLYVIRSIKIGILILCLAGMYEFLDYLITDDTEYMTRITFHDFYEMEQVDSLFVGASHGLKGVNAEMLSEKLGEEVFVAATSSQDVLGSYYILRDAIGRYDLQNVYLEISPAIMNKDRVGSATSVYIITDYMKNLRFRSRYILEAFPIGDWIPAFLRVRRNFDSMNLKYDIWGNIWEIPEKKDENYKNYLADEEKFEGYKYLGRGTWVTENERSILIDKESGAFDNTGEADLNPDALSRLSEIISLCEENGIHLTLYMMPYPEIYLYKYTNYDEFSSYFGDLAKKHNLDWFDLNLVKSKYLDLNNEDFCDNDHLSASGNRKTSDFLSEYLPEPEESYFWDSLEEKMEEEWNDVHILAVEYERKFYDSEGTNIEYWTTEEDYETWDLSVVSNGVNDLEYQVYYCYGLDEDKSIKGLTIDCVQITLDAVSFTIPYEYRGCTIAIEVADKKTKENFYRFLVVV